MGLFCNNLTFVIIRDVTAFSNLTWVIIRDVTAFSNLTWVTIVKRDRGLQIDVVSLLQAAEDSCAKQMDEARHNLRVAELDERQELAGDLRHLRVSGYNRNHRSRNVGVRNKQKYKTGSIFGILN